MLSWELFREDEVKQTRREVQTRQHVIPIWRTTSLGPALCRGPPDCWRLASVAHVHTDVRAHAGLSHETASPTEWASPSFAIQEMSCLIDISLFSLSFTFLLSFLLLFYSNKASISTGWGGGADVFHSLSYFIFCPRVSIYTLNTFWQCWVGAD